MLGSLLDIGGDSCLQEAHLFPAYYCNPYGYASGLWFLEAESPARRDITHSAFQLFI